MLQERSSYLDYQKTVREVEHLEKLHIAYQFVKAEVQKTEIVECRMDQCTASKDK
jgi:structural maintenance of chromosome 2